LTFLLVRVDDRLLHGQVVFGWGEPLRPRRYLIADDRVAGDAWEQEAFRAAAPAGVAVAALDLRGLAGTWKTIEDPGGTIVLIRGLEDLARLRRDGFRPDGEINLGGRHAAAGGFELLDFLHLTRDEARALRELLDAGVRLYAQQVPGSPRHEAEALRARLMQLAL
jgi:mannose/fructose/N-acetylgalactosamine-specific phosphotransferase system component IIB